MINIVYISRNIIFVFVLGVFISASKINAQVARVDLNLSENAILFKISEPLNLWLDFLKSENAKQASKYWNKKEVAQYSDSTYFQLMDSYYFEEGNLIKTLNRGTTVLSITQIDSLYKITSMYRVEIDDSLSATPFIFNLYAGIERESGKLKLYNPFPINQKLLMQEKVYNNVKYIFPKNHQFNRKLARKQMKIITLVEKEFHVKLKKPTFIFTNNRSEFYRLLGYEFHFQEIGADIPFGKAFVSDNYVYTSGTGEFCPHELIHLLINPKWTTAHLWFIEGFATYFGGSRGKTLDWHLDNLKKYYKSHLREDYTNLLDKKNVDEMTDYRYVVGGLFVKMAYEKGGAELVKKLMSYEDTDTGFYKAIEIELGIKKENLNQFFLEYFN